VYKIYNSLDLVDPKLSKHSSEEVDPMIYITLTYTEEMPNRRSPMSTLVLVMGGARVFLRIHVNTNDCVKRQFFGKIISKWKFLAPSLVSLLVGDGDMATDRADPEQKQSGVVDIHYL
jgi:hypothetical protein